MKQEWRAKFRGRCLSYHELELLAKRIGIADSELATETFWLEFDRIPCVVNDGEYLICNRCGNEKWEEFAWIPAEAYGSQGICRYYCLQCLTLGRMIEGQWLFQLKESNEIRETRSQYPLVWKGQLSKQQAEVSQELVAGLQSDLPHLVQAVTGAGKTEMVFGVVSQVLYQGGRVAIASPRLDVILELAPRFQTAFADVEQEVLYGGCEPTCPEAQLILATTHQLWRFKAAFDLLIVDEIDAFPYQNHQGLHYAVQTALAAGGKLIYLTATPDAELLKQVADGQMVLSQLPARFHRHPLVEPRSIWVGDWYKCLVEQGRLNSRLGTILNRFVHLEGPKIIFMPRIEWALRLEKCLTNKYPNLQLTSVHAQDPQRKEKVLALRQGELELLVATTILERGVTFPNCQVIVVGADDPIFTQAALVQIAGRVGRKADYPSGELIWAHNGQTRAMKKAKRLIVTMNHLAKQRGLLI